MIWKTSKQQKKCKNLTAKFKNTQLFWSSEQRESTQITNNRSKGRVVTTDPTEITRQIL